MNYIDIFKIDRKSNQSKYQLKCSIDWFDRNLIKGSPGKRYVGDISITKDAKISRSEDTMTCNSVDKSLWYSISDFMVHQLHYVAIWNSNSENASCNKDSRFSVAIIFLKSMESREQISQITIPYSNNQSGKECIETDFIQMGDTWCIFSPGADCIKVQDTWYLSTMICSSKVSTQTLYKFYRCK